MILTISSEQDIHAVETHAELARIGADAKILDLSEFPRNASVSLDYDSSGPLQRTLHYRDETIDLHDVGAVWWRRPQGYKPHEEITDDDALQFVYAESHETFSGLWLTLDAFWMNPPARDDDAARKVWQLDVARELGLRAPRTCITNNTEKARQFIEREGANGVIYKPFTGTETAWRETRLLKPDEQKQLDAVRCAPVIFQEYIKADLDLRITVVGDEIFAAAIDSRHCDYQVDFRMEMAKAKFSTYQLPADIDSKLRQLMQRLNLVYGAIDMRVTPAGEHVFLEINPAGQWLFVQDKTDMPITRALAACLHREDVARRH